MTQPSKQTRLTCLQVVPGSGFQVQFARWKLVDRSVTSPDVSATSSVSHSLAFDKKAGLAIIKPT